MKLTTDQIVERHGLTATAHLGAWRISAPRFTPTEVAHPNRSAAVHDFCLLHRLEMETPDKPEPTVEQLIERHKITVMFLGKGNWRADVGLSPDLRSTYGITAAGAINELVARIEKEEEERQRASVLDELKATVKRGLGLAGFESGGYAGVPLTAQIKGTVAQAQPPAKKPAQVIAEAKAEAEKRIAEDVREHINSFGRKTGALITGVEVGADVIAAHLPGSDAKPLDARVYVTLTTG